jgi:hypothetical protein
VGAAGETPSSTTGASELRSDVSVWGSYMWGYADVGADIYVALGIVALAALGFTPLAFLAAGLVYAMVGLCYAELASAYPVAGGGLPIMVKDRMVDFPVLGVLGMIGVAITLFEVVLTHPLGRIAGPGWIVLCGILYVIYRRRQKLPALGNVPRNWEQAQKRVLREAEEFESLEEYEGVLADRDAGGAKPA